MNILQYIPTGHKNAISRQSLCIVTHLTDRKVRDEIAAVNANGNPDEIIINMGDGRGYFRPADGEDALVKAWAKIEHSRQLSVNENVKAAGAYLRRRGENLKGQMDIFSFVPVE